MDLEERKSSHIHFSELCYELSRAPPASDPTPWNLQENNTQPFLVV